MGGASLELEVASKYVTVPLSVSDITLRGRVLMQTAPHPDPPYLGRCSLCFLRPPDMDFVLRPMRAFDVMEVPLLHRQLHATFQSALCAPLLWPQQVRARPRVRVRIRVSGAAGPP